MRKEELKAFVSFADFTEPDRAAFRRRLEELPADNNRVQEERGER